MSLSARRAWIEITNALGNGQSVDRNKPINEDYGCNIQVALRKESVDRNVCMIKTVAFILGRSPQGERG